MITDFDWFNKRSNPPCKSLQEPANQIKERPFSAVNQAYHNLHAANPHAKPRLVALSSMYKRAVL